MKLETLATLTHINVRKEGKDEKVLSRHADAGAERAETKVRTLDEWPFPVDKTAQPADQVKPRRKGKKAQQEASAP